MIDTSDNDPISDTCLVDGDEPIWMLVKEDMEDTKILDSIRDKYIKPAHLKDVLLLYDCNKIIGRRQEIISNWCLSQEHQWNFLDYRDISGSEALTVVLFELYFDDGDLECLSRARHCLLIIHR